MKIPPTVNLSIGKMTAVLYSVEQGCFHLESVSDYILNNVSPCLTQKRCNEYRLICICNSDIEGDAYIEHFREMQEKIKSHTLDDLISAALLNED